MPLPAASAATVTLAWDANTEPDLDGYKIYYGSSSRNYSLNVDVGNVVEYTITGLQEGATYYFAAKAYDYTNHESAYSQEVVYTIPSQNNAPNTPATPSGPSSGYTQTNYSFNTSGSDPDGDALQYQFDWGDGGISGWGGASNRTHAWSATGNFCVKAQARDEHGALSAYSACRNISIAVNTHTITATAGANGSMSPSGAVAVTHGAGQTFTITPHQNYHVADVVVDGASLGARTSYAFTNITQNHSISASFALDNQTPTANAGADQTVTEGTVVSLSGANSTDPGGSIVSYHWEQTAGTSVNLSNPNAAATFFTAPNVSFAGETLTFRLTVIDNSGLQDVGACSIHVTKAQVADSDGDGVPDDQDDFPFDPDEWLDSDGDGIGNNADEDDDDDSMPDVWEDQYGLDPLSDDADEDPDGDGVSNIDEYLAGTDPTIDDYNDAPDAPVVLSPANSDVVSLLPVLQTAEFYDPDNGDSHLKTQWQIFDQLSDDCVVDVETPTSLTALTVPRLILDENTAYYWKARFFDNHGTPSQWSVSAVFSTDFNSDDLNGDGIPDHQELAGPTDMDRDRIPDAEQDHIKCLSTEDGLNFLGLSFKGSATVAAIDSVMSEDAGEALTFSASVVSASVANKPKHLPFGLLSFKLLVNEPGDEAEVTIYFSERWPKGSKWYKYDSIEDSWRDFSDNVQFSPNRKSVILTLTDGGLGDADGIANGIIVDPAGIGTAAPISDDGGGGSGSDLGDQINDMVDSLNVNCFIVTAAQQSQNQEPLDLWREICGRVLPIICALLVLICAGKVLLTVIKQNRKSIRAR